MITPVGQRSTQSAQRVHSYEILRSRIEAQGLNADSFEFYLKAFRFGMPIAGTSMTMRPTQ